ncbi:MAG: KTSC domain-containing protein [Saprospiraceae bacterium]|nr:KTSC domain-containing protein [Saprospiraceae bacterium]
MTLDSYFNILEIKQTTSKREIKSAWKKCLFKYHPDKADQSNEEELKQANQKTIEINKAYDYLKNNIIDLDPFEEAICEVEINWDIRKGVSSSNLKWIEYYKELHILIVQFKSGGLYLYESVNYETYVGLVQSDSKGRFLNKNIAYKFIYHRLAKYEDWYKFGKQIFHKQLNNFN